MSGNYDYLEGGWGGGSTPDGKIMLNFHFDYLTTPLTVDIKVKYSKKYTEISISFN